MNDNTRLLIGMILIVVGMSVALTFGGAMGQDTENFFVGLLAYAGGFITAFIGAALMLKVYQKNKKNTEEND